MAYPDPYQRPAPDHFVRRWLFITACIAALMLLWQFLPAIEAWFSPREAADRTGTARGDLAADEKATIELFEKSRASVVYITTAQLVRDRKPGNAGTDDGDFHGRPPLAGAWNKRVAKRPETNKRGREEKRFRRSVGTRRAERLRNVKTVRRSMRPCNRQNGVVPPKFQPRG